MATGRRHDGRLPAQLRAVRITPGFVRTADGSCLMEMGRTRVICTASFIEGVPPWRKGSGQGWVTAEYGMLPASTGSRKARDRGHQDGRGVEIQRLIGRVIRSVVRFEKLGENTIYLDCDVLEADGGTRTAAINGAYVALAIAVAKCYPQAAGRSHPLAGAVAAVSVGIVDGRAVADLDYAEDSTAEVDMNLAMTSRGRFVELQGAAERAPFDQKQLQQMLRLGRAGVRKILAAQAWAIRKAQS